MDKGNQGEIFIKTEIKEELIEEELTINQEKVVPEYVNVNLYSSPSVKLQNNIYEDAFPCSGCKNKYKKLETLEIHRAVHNVEKSKICPVCNESYDGKKRFIIHVNSHIKEILKAEKMISYDCEYCSKKFNTKKSYVVHVRVHTNERPYKCNICGEAFKQLGSLKDHNVTHTKEKRFVCEVCTGSFTTPSSLKRHVKRIHGKEKSYHCRCCNKKFLSPTLYKEHRKESVSYSCLLCGEKFFNSRLYRDHKMEHMFYNKEDLIIAKSKKWFSCKICKEDFPERQSLFKHMDHHFDKSEKCDVCQLFFSHYGLVQHRKILHQDLVCKICDNIFHGKIGLMAHCKKVHREKQRFPCNMCHRTYLKKFNLYVHIQRDHEYKKFSLDKSRTRLYTSRFKCVSCSKIFENEDDLPDHKKVCNSVIKKEHIGEDKLKQKNQEIRNVSMWNLFQVFYIQPKL